MNVKDSQIDENKESMPHSYFINSSPLMNPM